MVKDTDFKIWCEDGRGVDEVRSQMEANLKRGFTPLPEASSSISPPALELRKSQPL